MEDTNKFRLNPDKETVSMLGSTTKVVKKGTYFKIDGVLYQVSSRSITNDGTIEANTVLTNKGTFLETIHYVPRKFSKMEVQQNMVDVDLAVLMIMTAFKKLEYIVKADAGKILIPDSDSKNFYYDTGLTKPFWEGFYNTRIKAPDLLSHESFSGRGLAEPLIDLFSPESSPNSLQIIDDRRKQEIYKIIKKVTDKQSIPNGFVGDNPQN